MALSEAQVRSNLAKFAASNKGSYSTAAPSPSSNPSDTFRNSAGQLVNTAGNVVGGAVTSSGISYDGRTVIPGSGGSGQIPNLAPMSPNASITSDALRPANLVSVPSASTPRGQAPSLESILASLGGTPAPQQQAEQKAEATTSPSLANILSFQLANEPVREKSADIYGSLDEKRAVDQARQQVSQYSNQLNAITAQRDADLLRVRGTGAAEGVTEAVYGGQQATINREAAIRALPVAAQLSAAQGNLELAQQQLDTMFKLRVADAEAEYETKSKRLESIVNLLSTGEKRAYEQRKEENAARLEEVKTREAIKHDYAKYLLADSPEYVSRITSLDAKSDTFDSDLSRAITGIPLSAKKQLENAKLQAEINKTVGPTIDTSKLTPEAKGVLNAVANIRFTSVAEGDRIMSNIKTAIYNGDVEGAVEQLNDFGYQKLSASQKTDYDLYDGAKDAFTGALSDLAVQNIESGPYKNLSETAKPWLAIQRDKKYVDLKSLIELGQAQLRKGFYGTAVTGTEANNAKSFIIEDRDDIDTVRWKLQNAADFLRFTNDAMIAKSVNLDKPNIDDYLTYRVRDKETGQTGLVPRSEYSPALYEILSK